MSRDRKPEVEQAIARKQRLLEQRGGQFGRMDNCPPEVFDRFLTQVLAFETAPHVPLFEVLRGADVPLPAPDTLDDASLRQVLARLIDALARRNVFLGCTDHLSDRQLYTELWRTRLREPTVLLPNDPDVVHCLDMAGSGQEDETHTFLRYYADEDWRRRWAHDWPADPLPPHEDPPYDRDRWLPQPPTRRSFRRRSRTVP